MEDAMLAYQDAIYGITGSRDAVAVATSRDVL